MASHSLPFLRRSSGAIRLSAVLGIFIGATLVLGVPEIGAKTAPTKTTVAKTTARAVASCEASPESHAGTSKNVTFPLANWELPTGQVRETSPTVLDIPSTTGGSPETVLVFGDENGTVYVVDASTCQSLPGWPEQMSAPPGQSAAIESSPAVGWLDGPNSPPTIVVGSGSTWVHTNVGEVEAFNWNGTVRWVKRVKKTAHNDIGVFSSPAIGDVTGNGQPDIVFGSWDYYLYVLDKNGHSLPGTPFYNAETIWSSPALYAPPGRKADDIFIGNDKTNPKACFGADITDLRYEKGKGLVTIWVHCQGVRRLPGFGQAIWSSPIVAQLKPGGPPAVIVGTSFYDHPFGNTTNDIWAYNAVNGTVLKGFPVKTNGPVLGTPAVGDIGGDGAPAIVDTSWICTKPIAKDNQADCLAYNSDVSAWTGSGKLIWRKVILGSTDFSSPVLIPLQGETTSDVLVGSGDGLYPLDGMTGNFLFGTDGVDPPAAINPGCRLFNSPAVANVTGTGMNTGWYAFELCSYPNGSDGLFAFKLPVQPPTTLMSPWPMFHDDAQHTGVAWATLSSGPFTIPFSN